MSASLAGYVLNSFLCFYIINQTLCLVKTLHQNFWRGSKKAVFG
ncbi:Uncharacterized protein dnm_048440 [Desulfonema magnum]|uniref:Uncharacterized protein n=1 Tax=Desulfonema magnum TaxID=45655 RepID=A0A975GPF5_9BACT|nr:Uncharacterized protein dnm_048440 [Desulfonema magnum]